MVYLRLSTISSETGDKEPGVMEHFKFGLGSIINMLHVKLLLLFTVSYY